jgi:hypothetical protein
MRLLRVCASVVALAAGASTFTRAQTGAASVQTMGAVHIAAFETPQGVVRVHVSSDAAAGDTISGMVLAQPAGSTPQAREANLGQLNGFVVEWQGQQTPVSMRRYEWLIPTTVGAGSGALSLRDRNGRLLSQASLPIDPVPAPALSAPSPAEAFELPRSGEVGKNAVVRGPSDGTLTGKTVSVGGTQADLLAASPRQLAFSVPATTASGQLPVRFASNDRVIEGTMRVLAIQLKASNEQLIGGQRATLTVTVSGLNGITEPMKLTMLNRSPATVRVENIDRPITIEPGQVARQGTFVVTRRITGVRAGRFQIVASVGNPPLAQFDVQRAMNRALADWQAKQGIAITPDANALIQRSVLEARTRLDEFLRQQQAHEGDVEGVFAALLSHYCFDLRDDSRSRRRTTAGAGASAGIMLVALRQNQAATVEITATEVRRLSFSEFLSQLIGHFTTQQSIGYLLVRSMPDQIPVTIDGQRRGEMTNRRIVTSVGEHLVVVAGSKPCRQRVTITAFQLGVVECAAS